MSVNKVILVGRLGQDPEVKYTPNGAAIANVSIATSERWKDKQSGETQERTEWHRVVFFNRTAEVVGQYLRKGSQVYIEGRLQTRKWQDKQGADRYSTEIVASEMQMLGSRAGGDTSFAGNEPPAGHQQNQSHPSAQAAQNEFVNNDFDDDDIPF